MKKIKDILVQLVKFMPQLGIQVVQVFLLNIMNMKMRRKKDIIWFGNTMEQNMKYLEID